MEVGKKHQLKIARDTLKMSCAGARIMGGMDHCEAFLILKIAGRPMPWPAGCDCIEWGLAGGGPLADNQRS